MNWGYDTCSALVVDDERLVVKYTVSLMERLGCRRVLEAGSAQAAREMLARERIDLLISDISLPDEDGRELLRKALAEQPHLASILMTGFSAGELTMPKELEVKAYLLGKPFNQVELDQAVRKAFAQSAEQAHRA